MKSVIFGRMIKNGIGVVMLVGIFTLASCNSPSQELALGDSLATSVAATIQALPSPSAYPSETPTRRLPPTPYPTMTSGPSLTALPSLTDTPTVTPTETEVPVGGGEVGKYQGGGNYACQVMGQKPNDWQKVKPDTLIYAFWNIKNVGAKDWKKGGIDILFLEGDRMDEYGALRELWFDIPAGDTREIVVVLRSPKKGGDYKTVWGLRRGDNVFCEFTIGVSVR